MEPINDMPDNILEWLHGRRLTDEVIKSARLSWNGDELVIPVFDEQNNFLFNKYRRNPASVEGPKYRYEKGSTSALYNSHTLSSVKDEPVFICEGELDCLLLNSKGQHAVTSTGGSGTFKKEWADFFVGKNVYISFDADDAGYKGGMKTQGILPFAKTIILPEGGGKDVTDYFQNHTLADFFALDAITYPIPREPSGMPQEKKEMKAVVEEFGKAADELLIIKRDFQSQKKSVKHLIIYLEYVTSRYETFSHMLKSFDRKFTSSKGNGDDVRRAKEVSILQYVKFNYNNLAPCIAHKDRTPSMRYNKPGTKYGNTVKCYSCGFMGDTIDVVMLLNNLDFGDAVKYILK